MATISGVNYKKIISAGAESYDLVPFDASGKSEQFMTIEVDTTLGAVNLNLPEIVNFGGVYNTTINIIALTGATNDVVVNCGGSDLIGSAASLTISTDGGNVTLNPVAAASWSAVVSA